MHTPAEELRTSCGAGFLVFLLLDAAIARAQSAGTFAHTGDMRTARSFHMAFDKARDLPGVNRVRVRVPSGIVAGPVVPVWLTFLDRPSNEVTIAVR